MIRTPDHNTLYVEFCRDCEAHSWCTHHDEAKYRAHFARFQKVIAKTHPDLYVRGNQLPQGLIPMKGDATKFYDPQTKKWIVFPAIGSFQIFFRGHRLFSKKKTNTWPDFRQISARVGAILQEPSKGDGNFRHSIEESEDDILLESGTDKDTITFTHKNFETDDKRTTFCKESAREQKNFTLTDHFKIYKMRKQQEEKNKSPKEQSHPVAKTYKAPESFEQKWEQFSNQNSISDFIKSKAYFKDEKGKKEMIINLDSIEEESFMEENPITRRDFERGKGVGVVNKWNEELNFLEEKFRKFEKKMSKIKETKKEIDKENKGIEAEWLQRMRKAGNTKEPSICLAKKPRASRITENAASKPECPQSDKTDKFESYMMCTEEEKNQKLHQIYGEWKLLKAKPHSKVKSKKAHLASYDSSSEESEPTKVGRQIANPRAPQKLKLPNMNPTKSGHTRTQRKSPAGTQQFLGTGISFRSGSNRKFETTRSPPAENQKSLFSKSKPKLNRSDEKLYLDSPQGGNSKNFHTISPPTKSFHEKKAKGPLPPLHQTNRQSKWNSQNKDSLKEPSVRKNLKKSDVTKAASLKAKTIGNKSLKKSPINRNQKRRMKTIQVRDDESEDSFQYYTRLHKKAQDRESMEERSQDLEEQSGISSEQGDSQMRESGFGLSEDMQAKSKKRDFTQQGVTTSNRKGDNQINKQGREKDLSQKTDQIVTQQRTINKQNTLTNRFHDKPQKHINEVSKDKKLIDLQIKNADANEPYQTPEIQPVSTNKRRKKAKNGKQLDEDKEKTQRNMKTKINQVQKQVKANDTKQLNPQQQCNEDEQKNEKIKAQGQAISRKSKQKKKESRLKSEADQQAKEELIYQQKKPSHKRQKNSKDQRQAAQNANTFRECSDQNQEAQIMSIHQETDAPNTVPPFEGSKQNVAQVEQKIERGQKYKEANQSKPKSKQKNNKKESTIKSGPKASSKNQGAEEEKQENKTRKDSNKAVVQPDDQFQDCRSQTQPKHTYENYSKPAIPEAKEPSIDTDTKIIKKEKKKNLQATTNVSKDPNENSNHLIVWDEEDKEEEQVQESENSEQQLERVDANETKGPSINQKQKIEQDIKSQENPIATKKSKTSNKKQKKLAQQQKDKVNNAYKEMKEIEKPEFPNNISLKQKKKANSQLKNRKKKKAASSSNTEELESNVEDPVVQPSYQDSAESQQESQQNELQKRQELESDEVSESKKSDRIVASPQIKPKTQGDVIKNQSLNKSTQGKKKQQIAISTQQRSDQQKRAKGQKQKKEQDDIEQLEQESSVQERQENHDGEQSGSGSQFSHESEQEEVQVHESDTSLRSDSVSCGSDKKQRKDNGANEQITYQTRVKAQEQNESRKQIHKPFIGQETLSAKKSKGSKAQKSVKSKSRHSQQIKNNEKFLSEPAQSEDKMQQTVSNKREEKSMTEQKVKEENQQRQESFSSQHEELSPEQQECTEIPNHQQIAGENQQEREEVKQQVKETNKRAPKNLKQQHSLKQNNQETLVEQQIQQKERQQIIDKSQSMILQSEQLSTQKEVEIFQKEHQTQDVYLQKTNSKSNKSKEQQQILALPKDKTKTKRPSKKKDALKKTEEKVIVNEGNESKQNMEGSSLIQDEEEQEMSEQKSVQTAKPKKEVAQKVSRKKSCVSKYKPRKQIPNTVQKPKSQTQIEQSESDSVNDEQQSNNNEICKAQKPKKAKKAENKKEKIIPQAQDQEQKDNVLCESKQKVTQRNVISTADACVQVSRKRDQCSQINNESDAEQDYASKSAEDKIVPVPVSTKLTEPQDNLQPIETKQQSHLPEQSILLKTERKDSRYDQPEANPKINDSRQQEVHEKRQEKPSAPQIKIVKQEETRKPQREAEDKQPPIKTLIDKKPLDEDNAEQQADKVSKKVEQSLQPKASENRQTWGRPLQKSQQKERALITRQLFGQMNQREKNVYLNRENLNINDFSLSYKSRFQKWCPLSKIYPNSPLCNTDSLCAYSLAYNQNNLKSYQKVLSILASQKDFLIYRLFENMGKTDEHGAYGIWICQHYQWKCLLVDDSIPVTKQGQPCNTIFHHHKDTQLWLFLLEKALAISLGGYQELQNIEVSQLFHMLTGSNILAYRTREDPEKNSKLFSMIKGCTGKNFVIYCEQSLSNTRHRDSSKKGEPVFLINAVKTINSDEKLVELCETGKGEEKFWMKFQKFVQEFRRVQILQLRINHNSCRLPIENAKGTFTVLGMEFSEDSFGSIIIFNKVRSGLLRAFLYKEGKNNLLKLVGEAREKNKNQLFFDCFFTAGRYFVFVEAEHKGAQVSYCGEGQPALKIKEEVRTDGYRNDFTEYLAVEREGEREKSAFKAPHTLSSVNKFKSSEGGRSRLREDFMEFLLGEKGGSFQ